MSEEQAQTSTPPPSPGESPTEQPTETPAAGSEAPPPAADPVAPAVAGTPIDAPLVGPEVERLAPPAYWAKRIPDPSQRARPSPVFLAVVSILSLVADVGTKLWAEKKLDGYPGYVTIIENHLTFVLAKNRGGAWGLLQGTSENVRRPFFLLVSAAAIAFIVTLYRRLQPRQRALKWGLPLVLGGALGNVFDRIRYGHVIDFIDYRADWLRKVNELIAKYYHQHTVTDHWPTFNVADIAICIGVALMAIDMFTAKRGKAQLPQPVVTVTAPAAPEPAPAPAAEPEAPPPAEPAAEGEKSVP